MEVMIIREVRNHLKANRFNIIQEICAYLSNSLSNEASTYYVRARARLRLPGPALSRILSLNVTRDLPRYLSTEIFHILSDVREIYVSFAACNLYSPVPCGSISAVNFLSQVLKSRCAHKSRTVEVRLIFAAFVDIVILGGRCLQKLKSVAIFTRSGDRVFYIRNRRLERARRRITFSGTMPLTWSRYKTGYGCISSSAPGS